MTRDETERMDRFEDKLDKVIETFARLDKRQAVHEQAEGAHGLDSVKRTLQRGAAIIGVIVIAANLALPIILRRF